MLSVGPFFSFTITAQGLEPIRQWRYMIFQHALSNPGHRPLAFASNTSHSSEQELPDRFLPRCAWKDALSASPPKIVVKGLRTSSLITITPVTLVTSLASTPCRGRPRSSFGLPLCLACPRRLGDFSSIVLMVPLLPEGRRDERQHRSFVRTTPQGG